MFTNDQADGESQGPEEGPEGEVMTERLSGKALRQAGVVLVAADRVLGGRGDSSEGGQLHLGGLGLSLNLKGNEKRFYGGWVSVLA